MLLCLIDLSTKPHAVRGQLTYLAYIKSEMRPGSRLDTTQHYRNRHMKTLLTTTPTSLKTQLNHSNYSYCYLGIIFLFFGNFKLNIINVDTKA